MICVKGALSHGLNFFLWTPSSPRYVILLSEPEKKIVPEVYAIGISYDLEPYALP
jgi:hypothetical protein